MKRREFLKIIAATASANFGATVATASPSDDTEQQSRYEWIVEMVRFWEQCYGVPIAQANQMKTYSFLPNVATSVFAKKPPQRIGNAIRLSIEHFDMPYEEFAAYFGGEDISWYADLVRLCKPLR